MKCPDCGAINDESRVRCVYCDVPLREPVCPKCGTLNEKGAKRCARCRRDLNAVNLYVPVPPVPVPGRKAPEKKDIPTYFGWALFLFLLGNRLFGMLSIGMAIRIWRLKRKGALQEAWDESRKARTCCWVGYGVGLASMVILVLWLGKDATIALARASVDMTWLLIRIAWDKIAG